MFIYIYIYILRALGGVVLLGLSVVSFFFGSQDSQFWRVLKPIVPVSLDIGAVGASFPPVARVSPFNFSAFQRELALHPDRSSVEFVLNGIRFGFRAGFVPGVVPLVSSLRNMESAGEHPTVIDDYLGTQVASYWGCWSFSIPSVPSPLGLSRRTSNPATVGSLLIFPHWKITVSMPVFRRITFLFGTSPWMSRLRYIDGAGPPGP